MLTSKTHTILLAEDDDDYRAFLVDGLACHGFDTVAASNGADAMTHLDMAFWSRGGTKLPDVIVTDLRMPHCDGYQLLGYASYLPSIAITAFGDDDAHRIARQAGARYVFDKPFELADLVTAIGRITAHVPRRSATRESP